MMKKSDLIVYIMAVLSSILMIFVLSTTKSISYNIDKVNETTSIKTINNTSNSKRDYEPGYELDNLILKILMTKEDKTNDSLKELSNKGKPGKTEINTSQEKKKEPVYTYYIIKKGDCLWKIAKKNNYDLNELISINDIKNPNIVKIGQKLKLCVKTKSLNIANIERKQIRNKVNKSDKTYISGYYHKVLQGENLYKISKIYEVDMMDIIKAGNIKKPNRIIVGKKILIPIDKKIAEHRYLKNYKPKGFIWPILGRYTSGFGMRKNPITRKLEFHKGVDIAANINSSIIAAGNGTVIYSGIKSGYGRTVIIRHKGGYLTVYAHNKVNLVRVGQYVRRGQSIAKIGMTGITTGPHVHFEIRRYAKAVDPTLLISRKYLR